jgi:hypothetical protein
VCMKLNSIFVIGSKRALVLTTIFTFIYINFAIAEATGSNFDDLHGAGSQLLPEQKIVQGWLKNDNAFAQHGLDLRPNIVFPPNYFLEENNFQLDVPIHTGSADKEIIYLHFYETSNMPANKEFHSWSGSFNDTSKQASSLSLSEPDTKMNMQGFYRLFPMATADNLAYQYLSTRTSSSLILVGVGLISFGCLRIRTRRLEVVKL